MKTIKNIIIVTVLLAVVTTAYAKSWRINNNTATAPDFTDLNTAVASENVLDGDTLYLDPGCNLTTEQNVTKKVVIVGVGFGSGLPYNNAIISGRLNLKAKGCKIFSTDITGTIYICANNVTIERCRTQYIGSSGVSQFATIRQCLIQNSGTAIGGQGRTSTNTAMWTIENCIIRTWNEYARCIEGLYTATIRNNLLLDNDNYNYSAYNLRNLGSATVTNNIIVNTYTNSYAIADCDGQFYNNVISQDYASTQNQITNSTNTGLIYTGDMQSYTLIENSPAAGYGTDGNDCGIFGGLYPYVKGGLPSGYPYYTKAVITPRSENGKIKVSLNIKMQNE